MSNEVCNFYTWVDELCNGCTDGRGRMAVGGSVQSSLTRGSCLTLPLEADFSLKYVTCRTQNAAVYAGSFLEYDWSDGDVVFANSTCFPEELMDGMTRQVR